MKCSDYRLYEKPTETCILFCYVLLATTCQDQGNGTHFNIIHTVTSVVSSVNTHVCKYKHVCKYTRMYVNTNIS